MTKLDDCIKTVDPALIVFDSPTGGVGTPSSNFQGPGRPTHMGVDIAVPVETAVRAVEYGIVWRTIENHKDYGNCIIVRHTENIYSLYAHLSDGGIDVRTNECVEKGDTIGLSGNTGRSTGPHLHFEVLRLPDDTELAQKGTNKKGEPSTGIKSTEYRIDPSFIFSEERKSLLEVSAATAAKSSVLPGIGVNAAVLGLVAWAINGPLALIDGWIQAGGAVLAHGASSAATFAGVRAHLRGKERTKWEALRESMAFLVTSEVAQKQLSKAEKSGRRSPNQQRKIEQQIRAEISAAHSAASGASSKLDRLSSELQEVRREMDRVRSDAAKSIDNAEAAAKRSQETDTRLRELADRERTISEQARDAAKQAAAAGEQGAAAARRFEDASTARQQHIRADRPDTQMGHQDTENGGATHTSEDPLTVTNGSTLKMIILRAGEDIDSASDDLSTENALPLRTP